MTGALFARQCGYKRAANRPLGFVLKTGCKNKTCPGKTWQNRAKNLAKDFSLRQVLPVSSGLILIAFCGCCPQIDVSFFGMTIDQCQLFVGEV